MKKRICGMIVVIALVFTLIPVVSMESTAASDPIVIVLDPGHGGSDPGAISSGGITEESVNLKIATYMKEQLEEYSGVEVYMTRTSNVYVGISERADIANSYDADLFISIHANSSTSSSANGAEVYYPNGNYTSNYSTSVSYSQTKALAQSVQDGLVSLGLTNRGIFVRNATTDKYADGTTADYYGVIRYNKIYGIPAILIEHGFLSNSSDVSNYFNSDTKLKALATSNVEAIVETLGLTTASAEISITAPTATTYVVGDTLDSTGMTVKATYSNGTTATLKSSEYTISGFDSSSTGNKVVTVSYLGDTAKFVVCILAKGSNVNSTVVGDVNGDGEVKSSDYLMIKDSYFEGIVLSEAQATRADVKPDGEIRASDYLMIKDYFMEVLDYLVEPVVTTTATTASTTSTFSLIVPESVDDMETTDNSETTDGAEVSDDTEITDDTEIADDSETTDGTEATGDANQVLE